MYDNFVRERITALRMEKKASERGISMDLGHSPSYIHNIVSRGSLPSLPELFYICEYFGLTPMEFFDEGTDNPVLLKEVIEDMKSLDEPQLKSVHQIIKQIKK